MLARPRAITRLRAGRKLPDVGDERGDDEQGGCLNGRHDEAERAHGDGRETHAHHAL
jgi:hypothetical protein